MAFCTTATGASVYSLGAEGRDRASPYLWSLLVLLAQAVNLKKKRGQNPGVELWVNLHCELESSAGQRNSLRIAAR